jgi:hypothetical protein
LEKLMSIQRIPLELSTPQPPILPTILGGQALMQQQLIKNMEPPKLVWAQNILPTDRGLSTVLFSTYADDTVADAADHNDMIRVYTVWDETGDLAAYYFYANGNHVVFKTSTGLWEILMSGGNTTRPISVVYVNGRTYVHAYGGSVYYFEAGFTGMGVEPILDLDPAVVLGFTSTLNYAIAWDEQFVYWSAPGMTGIWGPLDGTILTGAGSTQVIDLVGQRVTCQRINNGFIIYGTTNIVAARYSGNSRNPWIFRGLESSAPLVKMDGVNSSDSSSSQFAWTTEGLKEINLTKCENIFPEVSKYLSGITFTTSDNDGTFTENTSTVAGEKVPLAVKCAFIGDRYFTISYGSAGGTSFPLALIFDVSLKQWGILRIDHVDLFELLDIYDFNGTPTGDRNWGIIGVLSNTGVVYSAKPIEGSNYQAADIVTISEIIIKEIKMSFNLASSINNIRIEGYAAPSAVEVLSFAATDTANPVVSFTNFPVSSKSWLGDSAGLYHQIRMAGIFNITGMLIDINSLGRY